MIIFFIRGNYFIAGLELSIVLLNTFIWLLDRKERKEYAEHKSALDKAMRECWPDENIGE